MYKYNGFPLYSTVLIGNADDDITGCIAFLLPASSFLHSNHLSQWQLERLFHLPSVLLGDNQFIC